MWGKILCTVSGIFLMACPAIFNYSSAAADNDHIVGPVIATFAIVSFWEATDKVQRWCLPLGIWLLLAPWILGYTTNAATIVDSVLGILSIVGSLSTREIKNNFGGGWKSLWQENPEHIQSQSAAENRT